LLPEKILKSSVAMKASSLLPGNQTANTVHRWILLYALPLSMFLISTVLFQYHEEHQYLIHGHGRSYHAGPLSCSFTNSPHYFDSGNCELRPLMVYHSEKPCYMFSILHIAVICRKVSPAYNQSHL
jgi:hypothetical protein